MNQIELNKTVENHLDCDINSNKNNLELVKTNDGSITIYHQGIGEHYHSHHGALQESKHVFLYSGLQFFLAKNAQQAGRATESVSILELGFGTGLNYLLTADYCSKNKITLRYTGIERFPLPQVLIKKTGYGDFVAEDLANNFHLKYPAILTNDSIQNGMEILDNSFLKISVLDAIEFIPEQTFDVLYYDAFSAIHQPEMWTKELLAHLCNLLNPGGVFVTYAITGNLKRILKSLGFQIEKAPGAPGKREMLRAISPL